MKFLNKDNWKRNVRRTLAALLCAGTLLPLSMQDAQAVDAAEIVSNVKRGIVYIFKWEPLLDGEKALEGTHYATMLSEKNTCISGPDILASGPDNAQLKMSANYTPYKHGQRKKTDVFYTVGSMGAPIICRQGEDDDNDGYEHTFWLADSEYPYAPRNLIRRDGKGDWDEFSEKYEKSLTGNKDYDDWIVRYCDNTIKGNNVLPNIDISGTHPGVANFTIESASGSRMMIFYNKSNKRDPAWQIYGNGNVWCDCESKATDRCWFNIWYGFPTAYSCLQQSLTIKDGQTLTLDSESENYRGIYIPPTATLKVEKGGTLAINETVYNDGTILCDGGTVIIQGNGSLSPLSSDDATVTDREGNTAEIQKYDEGYYQVYNKNGKNKIIVQNGGALIIMPDGKLYTTPMYPMTMINSRLINFGNYVMGGDLELYSSTVENREGGLILCGWNYADGHDDLRATFADAEVSAIGCSNMDGDTIYPSVISVYDTEKHYKEFGWLISAEGSNVVGLNEALTESAKKLVSAGDLTSEMQKVTELCSRPLTPGGSVEAPVQAAAPQEQTDKETDSQTNTENTAAPAAKTDAAA